MCLTLADPLILMISVRTETLGQERWLSKQAEGPERDPKHPGKRNQSAEAHIRNLDAAKAAKRICGAQSPARLAKQ